MAEIRINKKVIGFDGYPRFKGTADGHKFGACWSGNWQIFIHSELSDWNRDRRMALHNTIKIYLQENEKELLDDQTQPNKV